MTKGIYQKADKATMQRRYKELQRLTAMPLAEKIALSDFVIQKALMMHPRPAILYSGGKDSEVLLRLVTAQAPGILVMHNDTTLGEPAALEYVRRRTQGLNYIETTAPDPIELWQEKGCWPLFGKRQFTKWKRRTPGLKCSPVVCCYNLKEAPAIKIFKDYDAGVIYWGNRAAEGMRRRLTYLDNGFLFKPKQRPWYHAYPLQHWREEDILAYLAEEAPDYPVTHSFETGCLCCATDITYYPNNLSRLYQRDPTTWAKYMTAGLAEQIMLAKGIEGDPVDIIENNPLILLRVQ